MNKDSELFVRGVFDLGVRRKPQAFAADAESLWILNPNMLIVNELHFYSAKPRWRNYSTQCCLSMAQFSVRGACGFLITGDTGIGPKDGVLSEPAIRLVPESWRSCKHAGIAAHQEGCH